MRGSHRPRSTRAATAGHTGATGTRFETVESAQGFGSEVHGIIRGPYVFELRNSRDNAWPVSGLAALLIALARSGRGEHSAGQGAESAGDAQDDDSQEREKNQSGERSR